MIRLLCLQKKKEKRERQQWITPAWHSKLEHIAYAPCDLQSCRLFDGCIV